MVPNLSTVLLFCTHHLHSLAICFTLYSNQEKTPLTPYHFKQSNDDLSIQSSMITHTGDSLLPFFLESFSCPQLTLIKSLSIYHHYSHLYIIQLKLAGLVHFLHSFYMAITNTYAIAFPLSNSLYFLPRLHFHWNSLSIYSCYYGSLNKTLDWIAP